MGEGVLLPYKAPSTDTCPGSRWSHTPVHTEQSHNHHGKLGAARYSRRMGRAHTGSGNKRKRKKTPWWRHQMETFSALLAFVTGIHWSPVYSPYKGRNAELWCFLWCVSDETVEQTLEWFQTPWCSLWPHYNDTEQIRGLYSKGPSL